MNVTLEMVDAWLSAKEDEHVEFKEAKHQLDEHKITKYCAALANEGGGYLVLGISPKIPRRVVGSGSFPHGLETMRGKLLQQLRIRVEAEEYQHPSGRLVVFSVPGRPHGYPIEYEGQYLMRSGESLIPMTGDVLRRIFDESSGTDFSAEFCQRASITDLDPFAIEYFRQLWARKTSNERLTQTSSKQLLVDAELVDGDNVTWAALALFGTEKAIHRYLPQAEIVYEYRSAETIEYQDRQNYSAGFFVIQKQIEDRISSRNDVQHYQDGFFIRDIPTFNISVVREAVLNAVAHRDYRNGNSIWIRQFPRTMTIVSPGGFLPGITPENVIDKSQPRNRLVAATFEKCGLVERSGQGIDRIFEACIKESKSIPDFRGTDSHQVSITMDGEVRDPRFLQFLEKASAATSNSFSPHDLMILDQIHREQPVQPQERQRLACLLESGVVEKVGRGRGTRHILSRRFYAFLGEPGVYTRKRGLDRDYNKELLAKHIADNARKGSPLADLLQVLPPLTRNQVVVLLRDLRNQGRICVRGNTRNARWFPAGTPNRTGESAED